MPRDARLWKKLVAIAGPITQATLRRLPPDLRAKAENVPLIFEPWINAEIAGEDLDPEALGLFVGDPHNITDSFNLNSAVRSNHGLQANTD